MKKIAVIPSGHIPSQWAHSVNVTKHADAFFNMGFETVILTVKRYREKKFLANIKNVNDFYGINRKIPIKFFTDKGIHYFRETILDRLILLLDYLTKEKLKEYWDPEKKISEYCKRKKIDLAYCRNYRTVIYNIQNEIPTVVEIHNPDGSNPFIKKIISLSRSCYLKKIITIDNSIKNTFVGLGIASDKILVLEDAADIEKFKEAEKNNKRKEIREKYSVKDREVVAMYIGQFHEGKGVEYLLKAAILQPKYKFIIVGGSDRDIKIQKRHLLEIKGRNIKNIIFTGYIPNSEVPYFCQAADVLLVPYTSESIKKFMSPIKIFEYLASGKPIIASDLPNISRVLKHNEHCILVKERDPVEINKAIEKFMKDPEFYRKVSLNNLKYAENFSYKKRVKKILDSLC